MEKRIYNRIVNICIGVAIIAVLLYGRAAAAGKGWIAISFIAASGIVSVCVYFLALSNESRVQRTNGPAKPSELLIAESPHLVPEFTSFAAQRLRNMTHARVRYLLRHQEILRRQEEMVLREEMLLHPDSFNRLCNVLLSEAAWHAKDSEPIADTIERITRAEAEMELIVISRAPSGTIFFKIRSGRPKGTRPDRPQIVEQVFDWVDATSSAPA